MRNVRTGMPLADQSEQLPPGRREAMSHSKASAIGRAALRGIRRHWVVIRAPIAIMLVVAYAVAFLSDEPLRQYTEAKMNRALKGHTARIKTLDFHPLGFSLDLRDVAITQDAHPDPAVLQIERLSASVHWRALLSGRLVADVEIEKPTVHVDLPQARKEISDPVPVKERGWQEALEAVYPLKINHFQVRNGDVTYVDKGPFKPLRVRDIDLSATNIRNVRSEDRTYPSDVRFSALVFESGRVSAAAGEVNNAQGVLVRVGELHLIKSTVGFVNKATSPPYRLFLTDADGALTNLSNHKTQGAAVAKLKGKFMGSGTATAEAAFEAEQSGPKFNVAVRIEEVSLPRMNDLFRAYGRFDA